ncbi:hypothetical protein JHV56_12785 [Arthrobacter sp. BHU FT2]|nr:hypothetical protein [Arthrobacter sp. BHU FT2]
MITERSVGGQYLHKLLIGQIDRTHNSAAVDRGCNNTKVQRFLTAKRRREPRIRSRCGRCRVTDGSLRSTERVWSFDGRGGISHGPANGTPAVEAHTDEAD